MKERERGEAIGSMKVEKGESAVAARPIILLPSLEWAARIYRLPKYSSGFASALRVAGSAPSRKRLWLYTVLTFVAGSLDGILPRGFLRPSASPSSAPPPPPPPPDLVSSGDRAAPHRGDAGLAAAAAGLPEVASSDVPLLLLHLARHNLTMHTALSPPSRNTHT